VRLASGLCLDLNFSNSQQQIAPRCSREVFLRRRGAVLYVSGFRLLGVITNETSNSWARLRR